MFENNENSNTEKKVHKDGRSWDTIGPRESYQEIVKIRDNAQWAVDKHHYDSKIKLLSDGFYLKIRLKESVIKLMEKQRAEEAEKQLRKQKKEKSENKRLNKKQRD